MKFVFLLVALASASMAMRVDLLPGVDLTIRSTNYPNTYPINSRTIDKFKYKLQPGDRVTIDCSSVDVPCSNKDKIEFSRNGVVTRNFCTQTPQPQPFSSGPFQDVQKIDIKLKTVKNPSPGTGFSCTVKTVSSSTPSTTPTTTTDQVQDDSAINSAICGLADRQASNLIVGGSDVNAEVFPFAAWLENCSGTLITNRWVLSASHCTVGRTVPSIRVFLGCTRILPSQSRDCAFTVPASDKFEAPGYTSTSSGEDVSLIRMSFAVPFSSRVRPACLPTARVPAADEVSMIVAGFGRDSQTSPAISDNLKMGRVFSIADQDCSIRTDTYAEIVCTRDDDTTPCNGDSGGFLGRQLGRDQRYTVEGTVSFGTRDCPFNSRVGYGEVFNFMTFIRQRVEANP